MSFGSDAGDPRWRQEGLFSFGQGSTFKAQSCDKLAVAGFDLGHTVLHAGHQDPDE